MSVSSRIFLTASQVGEQLGMTPGALAQLRYTGRGPKFVKLGGRAVRYRQSDVDEWVESCIRLRTDERPFTPVAG